MAGLLITLGMIILIVLVSAILAQLEIDRKKHDAGSPDEE